MRRALVVLALLVVQLLAGPGLVAGAAHADEGAERVALIGVSGLHWSDLTQADTPHLWELASASAIGSLSVRTVGNVTCPYDAWLTVSAGVRSAAGYRCGAPPAPRPEGEGAVIPDYRYLPDVAGQRDAGTLGEALRSAGQCSIAIGPGAALGLADRQGAVPHYRATPQQVSTADLERCRMIAMDVDDLVRPYLSSGRLPDVPDLLSPAARREALRRADAQAGALLSALPAGTAVLLAGMSDHGSVPHLRVAALREPGAAGRLLGSASTRREDISILPDLTATVLTELGVAVPSTVVGVPLAVGEHGATFERLQRADAAAQTMRAAKGQYFTALAVLQVVFYVLAFLLLRRRKALSWVRMSAVALAALPVTSMLVNLLPWADHLQLFGGMLAWWAAITALALAGPWRRRPLGPPAVVAAVTAITLVGDLLTGTNLQLNSFIGYSAEQGARYFGLGNIPFALLATSTLLTATIIAHRWPGKVGLAAIVGLGAFAMVLGGSGMGSDFGGVIAFVPGIAVTALILAGRRVSLVKLAAFCVAGGVIVMTFAWINYLRPPSEQTHLGRFVGQLLSGEALDVILRKLQAMLGTLLSPNLMPIVIAAVAFLVYAVLRPDQASFGVVPTAFRHSPALRAGLIGTLVSGVIGMLVNDSGAAVLAMALALAVPLLLATGVTALRPTREQVTGAPAGLARATR
ncbi:hypothetical protein [Nonomuraea jiangxiensis]|uniref:Phosphoglyceromutase n=1 Tax=Nonomuraea jiangxiensis TaxID=633440 RepID=A0A1G9LZY4_9ACTN|nr:hypothetical protein [Nonomuraea jiangxiensis]SDL67582.1 hypothetical protein SAMN05421869_12916 [Nonomuraea jiangxiensis]